MQQKERLGGNKGVEKGQYSYLGGTGGVKILRITK